MATSNINLRFVKEMSSIFPCELSPSSLEMPLKLKSAHKLKLFGLMDPANVCMIVPKTEEAYWFLTNYISNQREFWAKKLPDIKHEDIGQVKVSLEYFKKIINMAYTVSDAVKITSSKNYPIEVEFKHESYNNMVFNVILAPRVENE